MIAALPPYRTFVRRVGAGIIDAFVLAPLYFVQEWVLANQGGTGALLAATLVAVSVLQLLYSIALHARSGQTVGKRIARVIVLADEGRDITLRQALMREAPNVALASVYLGIYVPRLLRGETPFAAASGLSWAEAAAALVASAWFALEMLTMLANAKRRSLHDLLAGTIVVRVDALDEIPADRAAAA